MSTPHLNVATAFLAGLVSFISPCVLPLVPAYLSFLTGSTVEELKAQEAAATRARAMLHALAFICGFTVVFVLLGVGASQVGGALADHKQLVAQIGGAIVIVLGINMLLSTFGFWSIPWLAMDKRPQFRSANRSYAASALVGVGFAAGWSPCIGPILSAILLVASQQHTGEAIVYLLVYSAGLAVPFLLVAAAFNQSLAALRRLRRFLPAVEAVAGVFLILVGGVLVTNSFVRIAGWFYQYVPTPKL
ncbi:MAG: sulfite exporter TauE/SafE family protein [Candidatus Eremiobacteraeota bacterium]|nr:sulfite exporter TauE/SafE family protein [Candidatus Eremiobacteraeota bacterium]